MVQPPRRAGQDMANPSGLLLGAIQMLVYIGQPKVAEKIHNAWLRTMEDGVHTYDLFKEVVSKEKVSTSGFAKAVIQRLGQKPKKLKSVEYSAGSTHKIQGHYTRTKPAKKELVGVDIFLHWNGEKRDPNVLGDILSKFKAGSFENKLITNRGVKVYPDGLPETFSTDHWRCRFTTDKMDVAGSYQNVLELCTLISEAGLDIIKTENLCRFDGEISFSMGQGQ